MTAPGVAAAAAVRTAAALGVATGTAADPDSSAVGGCAGARVALPLLLLPGCAVAAAASAAAGAAGAATPDPFGCPRPCRPLRSPRLAPGSHSPHCRLPQSSTAGLAPRQTRAAQHSTQAAGQGDSGDESCRVEVPVCLQGCAGSEDADQQAATATKGGGGWRSRCAVSACVRARRRSVGRPAWWQTHPSWLHLRVPRWSATERTPDSHRRSCWERAPSWVLGGRVCRLDRRRVPGVRWACPLHRQGCRVATGAKAEEQAGAGTIISAGQQTGL